MRESISALLAAMPAVRLLDAFPTAEAALQAFSARTPDVALIDIRLPGMSGIECVAQVKSRFSRVRILIVTTYEERDLIFDSLRAGASGYILKNALTSELSQAIELVHAGGAPMSMPIARKLVTFFQAPTEPFAGDEKLTEREQQVLSLLARGYQYKRIADSAGISIDTVRTHIRHIYDKLHVQSRTEATVKYLGAARK